MLTKNITPIMALILIASTAMADEAPMADVSIDTDGDGVYTLSEIQVAFPTISADDFMVLDANGDGVVDMIEAQAGADAGLIPMEEKSTDG
ncbi:hypothetical protein [Aestuariibius sp. HNIBRBA575]|uniref:hypothetical protein n=1 Tax=Aestuariibius sp. HNIBRBA575 TaxID=3233343 RepID=UPI0034A47FC1